LHVIERYIYIGAYFWLLTTDYMETHIISPIKTLIKV